MKSSLKGASFLSLPHYSKEVIESDAFKANFKEIANICDYVKSLLDKSSKVRIKTNNGTDIEFSIKGRKANSAPGCLRFKGDLGSPPDIEVNIAPVEEMTNGIIKVDGSIPFKNIGILESPVNISIKNGQAKINTPKGEDFSELNRIISFDLSSSIVGELGFGFNPYSKLCGRMLEDEGAFKTFHIGVGSNSTIGGLNKAKSHIDFVIRSPIVYLDETKINLWSYFDNIN